MNLLLQAIVVSKIAISNLSDAVNDILENYNSEITKNTKKIIHEVSEDFKNNTKNDAPKGKRKKYYKNIDVKTTFENSRGVTDTWYVKDPEYRLTHLIKNGHQTKNGGRTKGNDFIDKNFSKAEKELESKIGEIL